MSTSAVKDQMLVTVSFDRENGVVLPTPREMPLAITPGLAGVFARAVDMNAGDDTPLSFTSLLVGMLTGSDPLTVWLKAMLAQQGATLARIGQSRGRQYDESSLNRIGAELLASSTGALAASVSARRAIEEAKTIAAALESPALDVRHLAAAYPILPDWHVDDFEEFGIDRLAWCRALGAQMAATYPGERGYWRSYTDRASPVPLTSFSADVYTEKDLIGIDRTVDALALLIASTRTDTPLAIGVFGPWGSGKSFFMRHLRRRIWGLAEREQHRVAAWIDKRTSGTATADDAPLYFGQVAQVEFNAWHYNEGNLVASLVDHLFRNLRVLPGSKDTELEERRASVLVQIGAAEGQVVQAATVLDRTKQEVERARDEVDRARADAESARQDVDARSRELDHSSSQAKTAHAQLDAAIEELGSDADRLDAGDVVRVALRPFTDAPALREARSAAHDFTRGVTDWRAFFARLWSPRSAAVVGLCLIVPLVAWLTHVLNDAWGAAVTVAAPALAISRRAVTYIREGRALFEAKLQALEDEQARRIDARRAELAAEQAKLQAAWDGKLAALRATLQAQRAELASREAAMESAARALAERTKELDTRMQERVSAETRLQALEAQLKRLSSALLLDEFIKDRSGTDEYRKQLGFLALVRRDFERLSDLIASANDDWCSPDKTTPAPLLNRIVLYIDDLDRCKVDTVVQVLEVVHLLLAFPLFVCVVAVDPRWIEQCLREKHKERFSDDGPEQDSRATVGDYLEKIFQIPIWMRELKKEQRAAVVKSLLGPTAAPLTRSATMAAFSGEAPPVPVPPPRPEEGAQLDGFQAAIDRVEEMPDPLRITEEEGKFVDRVAPLLSDKPRALKRFVNTYRLLKASLSDLDRQGFVTDSASSPYKTCLTQLAFFTGQPRLAPVLAREISRADGGDVTVGTWTDAVAATRPKELSPDVHASFVAALHLIPDATRIRLQDFRDWLPETTRYLFHRDD